MHASIHRLFRVRWDSSHTHFITECTMPTHLSKHSIDMTNTNRDWICDSFVGNAITLELKRSCSISSTLDTCNRKGEHTQRHRQSTTVHSVLELGRMRICVVTPFAPCSHFNSLCSYLDQRGFCLTVRNPTDTLGAMDSWYECQQLAEPPG